MKTTYMVTVTVADEEGATASIDVTITVTAGPVIPPVVIPPSGGGGGGGGGFAGGGGGGGGGPTPSELDFEWTVQHDLDDLDGGHGSPSGMWSDGTTLWILENGSGADDAVYAYDIETGERVEDREFDLDDANLAPRGVWSDRTTIWISDSGKDKLFAHDLGSGERLPGSDLALHPDNDDTRGIWSDGSTMWVLDARDDALFAYNLASGELLAEYALHDDNDTPYARIHRSKLDGAGCRAAGEFGGCVGVRRAVPERGAVAQRRSARLGGAEGAGARVREACAGMLARASEPGRRCERASGRER